MSTMHVPDINHVMDNTRPSPFFTAPLFRVCQRKPKNRKNGVGLGTRLHEKDVLISEFVPVIAEQVASLTSGISP